MHCTILHDCIYVYTISNYLYDSGVLLGSANECLFPNMYLTWVVPKALQVLQCAILGLVLPLTNL